MDGVLQQPGIQQMPPGANMDPQTAGILAAAFQGLQASGPSRMPTSVGQIIGGAGQAGMGAYSAQVKQNEATALQRAHMELYAREAEKYAADAVEKKNKQEGRKEMAKFLPGGENALPDGSGILGTMNIPGLLGAGIRTGNIDPEKAIQHAQDQETKRDALKARGEELRMKLASEQTNKLNSDDTRREIAANAAAERRLLSQQHDATLRFIAGLNVQARKDAAANRPESPVQKHVDKDGKVWERARGGDWMPALDPQGEQLTGATPGNTGKADAKALSENQAYDAMEKQITELQGVINGNEGTFTGTVGPKGTAGRLLETARGLIPGQEDAATPALDAVSKKELIIGNIRKLMDDSHFSNADKARVESALGTSNILTTKGNAVRSLENVRQFIRDKRIAPKPAGNGKAKAEDFFK